MTNRAVPTTPLLHRLHDLVVCNLLGLIGQQDSGNICGVYLHLPAPPATAENSNTTSTARLVENGWDRTKVSQMRVTQIRRFLQTPELI